MKYDIARSELVDFIPPGARRLLDVGCGVGRYAQEVRQSRPEIELWGLEPDAERAATARQHFDHFVEAPFPGGADQLPRGHFDVVTYNDVLEHLIEPGTAIDATRDLLAPGGVIVTSIPNVRHRGVVMPLIREGAWNYEDVGILDRTHLRFYTKRTMQEMFTERGWQVLDVQGVNPMWHWMDHHPRRRLTWARRLSAGRLDDFFYVQYVVTARPADVQS